MPAAVPWIPLMAAGVAGTGAVVGAKIQSNSAKRAAEAQRQSTSEALAYQREQDALTERHYMERWNDWKARYAAWEQRNFGGSSTPAPKGGGGGGAAVSPSAFLGSSSANYSPVMEEREGDELVAQPLSVADIGGWEDWRRYGVGGGVA